MYSRLQKSYNGYLVYVESECKEKLVRYYFSELTFYDQLEASIRAHKNNSASEERLHNVVLSIANEAKRHLNLKYNPRIVLFERKFSLNSNDEIEELQSKFMTFKISLVASKKEEKNGQKESFS